MILVSESNYQRRTCDKAVRVPALDNIPEQLFNLPWVGWMFEHRSGQSKPAKVPINPRTDKPANPADPGTGADFPAAVAAARRLGLDGVGVILTREFGLTGVDLDNCRDPHTGEITEWARQILDMLPNTYAEVSPSGRGIRLFVKGSLPVGCRKKSGKIEVYDESRYFTVTGNVLPGRPSEITDAGGGLALLIAKYLSPLPVVRSVMTSSGIAESNEQLLRKALAHSLTGSRLEALLAGKMLDHLSQSEADYELCRILGFWCGGDPNRIESIARESAAYRKKWDERRGSTTWIRRTIQKAIARLGSVYSPPHTLKNKNREDKSVSRPARTPQEQSDRLLDHIRGLRLRFGRPVGLSVRQVKEILGVSIATAARRLSAFVKYGQLILVREGTYGNKLASEYDLPEFVNTPATAPLNGQSTRCNNGDRLSFQRNSPPYTRTPGGLLSVWQWSPRRGKWIHYGDCPNWEAANALAGQQMARLSGVWSIGNELRRYVRGRKLRITRHSRKEAQATDS